MKQQSLSISIPEPCHEKWSDMTPAEKGRHCKSCQKTVVDFTAMPKVKIAEFVTESKGNLCGRFSNDQLNVELLPPKPTKSWMKYAAIVMGLIPAVGFGQKVTQPVVPQNPTHQSPIRGKIKLDANPQKDIQNKNVNVSGIVVDAHDGEPKILAQIKIMKDGKLLQTIETNFEGEFKTEIPEQAHLVIYYPGYTPQNISYKQIISQKNLRIRLQERYQLMGMIMMEKPNKQEDHSNVTSEQKLISEDFTVGDIEVIPAVLKPEEITTGEYVIEEASPRLENKDEEPLQMVDLPEVVITAKQIEHEMTMTGLYAVVTMEEEKKENWLKRMWKKLESLVLTSHSEAQKNKTIAKEEKVKEVFTDEFIGTENISELKEDDHKVTSVSIQPQVNIFPNPSMGIFNFQLPDGMEDFVIEISNMRNETIVRKNQNNFDGRIDLSSYPSGSYVVAIVAGGELINSQVIIKI